MKNSMLAFCLFLGQTLVAQIDMNIFEEVHPPFISAPSDNLPSDAAVNKFVQNNYQDNGELVGENTRQSLTAKHYSYLQYFQQIPVLNGRIDLHVDLKGNIILIQNHLEDLSDVPQSANNPIIGLDNRQFAWTRYKGDWVIAKWILNNPQLGLYQLTYNGNVLAERSDKLFKTLPDSTVQAMVFLVNPLNSAQKKYGSPFIDSSDLDVPQINAQRKWVSMKAAFFNDTFWLRTDRYGFGEVSDPITPPTFSLVPFFSFKRSMYQFEDVNAFYHITQYSNHVQTLGFTQLLPDSLVIDAHAYNGSDLSSFNFNVFPLELEFGEGGVDDAEDGEVVVHEFGHALSYMASPKTVTGWERQAMEEGTCDYFSTSYSRMYGDFGWKEVFNWDGHNPFWNGIKTGVTKYYPMDLTQSTNADRELWSSPLMCLYEILGKETTDTLVLEHLFYQTSNTTMPQMARAMLKIDSILWNKAHYYDIKECFVRHKILAWGTDLAADLPNTNGIKVLNSVGFMEGSSALIIQSELTDEIQIELYDFMGRKVLESHAKGEINLTSDSLESGVYVLYIRQNDVNLSVKLIKR